MEEQLKLGLTTVGDLLLNNTITTTNDKAGKLENIALTIPEYQRPYKWTVKNVNQLLEDIQEARNANKAVYRVGTLILHKKKDEDGKWRYDIVDGQQRTITFLLLLYCLNKKLKLGLEQKLAMEVSDNPYTLYNVRNNYKALERKIDPLSDADKLREFICKKCELIVVITENQSEAFQFFDSQNARGKKLYPHDLLKAYHLREMNDIDESETERIVGMWEELDQKELAMLFNEYLYRLKEWTRGNRPEELSEHNIDLFKGITAKDIYPCSQYYKGAFAYANELNHSHVPFVMGIQNANPFQICSPIIAGKPFFEYAKHYFDILADIRTDDNYEGHLLSDNLIVEKINDDKVKYGTGNAITRLMFDTAVLLYVDRFCPSKPSEQDKDYLVRFVLFAFIWAYSMRAQYLRLGWPTAQNYVTGESGKVNSFNIYKVIAESYSPSVLLSRVEDKLVPLKEGNVPDKIFDNIDDSHYLKLFEKHKFMEG